MLTDLHRDPFIFIAFHAIGESALAIPIIAECRELESKAAVALMKTDFFAYRDIFF